MTNIDNMAYDLLERPIDEQQIVELLRMMDDWKAQQYMDEVNKIDCPLKSKCGIFKPMENDLPF
jgi:hypothetical protein